MTGSSGLMIALSESLLIPALLAATLVQTTLALLAARDMDRRGQPGWIFGILVLFLPPAGVLVWVVARGRTSADGRRNGRSSGASFSEHQ